MQNLQITASLDAIRDLDLEPIVFKITHPTEGKGWSLERADSAVVRYRQFLELSLMYPEMSIVPTSEIDEVWHYHILDTAKYREDCDQIFGRPLDHFPYFGLRSDDDAQALRDAFEETKKMFLEHFDVTLVSGEVGCGTSCGESLCDNQACDTNSCTPTSGPPKVRIRPRPVRG